MSKNKILVAFFALLIFSGCSDELIPLNRQSKLIQFGTTMRMDLQTKTYYDNDYDGGTICWQEDNDQIKIYATDNGNIVGSSVYTVIPSYPPTYGSLSGGNLSWRPGNAFRFYGLYPETLTLNNNKLSLTVNAEQANSVDMKQVYMVARTDQDYGENPVSLDFYPLVTTITLIVENDRENAITTISDINLTSAVLSLAGTYTVNVGNGLGPKLIRDDIAWPDNIRSEAKAIQIKDNLTINGKYHALNFLLIPQKYEGSDIELSFNVNDSVNEKSYRESLEDVGTIKPGHRYFIWVAIKENGEITPPTISDGLAQLIGAFLRKQNNGLYSFLNEFYTQHQIDTEILPKISDLIDNHMSEVTMKKIAECFGADSTAILDIIFEKFAKMESFEVQQSPDLSSDIMPGELSRIFPRLKSLKIQLSNPYPAVSVDGMDYLEILEIHHAGNVTVKDCPNLTSVRFQNSSPTAEYYFENVGITSFSGEKGNSYTFKDCLDLTSVTLSNIESNFTGVEFDNCGISEFSLNNANAPNSVFVFKNMPQFGKIKVNRAKGIVLDNCGDITSFKAVNDQNTDLNLDVLIIKNMPNLTTLDAGNAKEIIIINCPNLTSITHNGNLKDWRNKTEDKLEETDWDYIKEKGFDQYFDVIYFSK